MSLQQCHKCAVDMVDDGEWFNCPCCRSRTRGIERQQAIHEAHMAELGMTEEEYTDWAFSHIRTTPLSEQESASTKRLVERLAKEWTPACEHDTVNPYLPK